MDEQPRVIDETQASGDRGPLLRDADDWRAMLRVAQIEGDGGAWLAP